MSCIGSPSGKLTGMIPRLQSASETSKPTAPPAARAAGSAARLSDPGSDGRSMIVCTITPSAPITQGISIGMMNISASIRLAASRPATIAIARPYIGQSRRMFKGSPGRAAHGPVCSTKNIT
jgi:hypothetical protein